MNSTELDVLIVGAGPVGLFLANECARRGMSYRIVEAHDAQSQFSKALAIFPRTLEIFDMAGIAEQFLSAANRVTSVAFVSHRRALGHIEFCPPDTPYRFVAMVPQDVTEKLLLENLRRLGGGVEYQTMLTSAHQTDAGVRAVVQHSGTTEVIDAKYLVGCDGAHSTVRELLGLQFTGEAYAHQYMLADVMTNDALAADEMQLCPSPHGPLAIFPISTTRRRLVATVETAEGDAPSLALVNRLLAERAPEGIVANSLVWSSYFRIHHRCVARMSEGRMFITGDAAHIHSPFGGQGMNTGLQDAWNLAWKLDLAARGVAKSALVESYSLEREPIVRGVIETTHFLTTVLGARNPLAQGIRDTAIPIITHIPKLEHAFVDRLSGLGISYKGSPIVEGAGRRYFGDRVRGNRIGKRFLLLVPGEGAGEAAKSLQTQFPEALDLVSSGTAELLLIRPDGYVAYESPVADAAAFEAAGQVLALQVRGESARNTPRPLQSA